MPTPFSEAIVSNVSSWGVKYGVTGQQVGVTEIVWPESSCGINTVDDCGFGNAA